MINFYKYHYATCSKTYHWIWNKNIFLHLMRQSQMNTESFNDQQDPNVLEKISDSLFLAPFSTKLKIYNSIAQVYTDKIIGWK